MRLKIISVLLFTVNSVFSQADLKSKSRNAKRAVVEEGDDGRSSLVFVFDTTGSMYNDLRQLREGAEMILQTALEESDVIADFVFVPFHDPVVGPATVTSDKKVFKSALNIVHVYGGGDCPEKSLGGIQLALNVSRPRSFLYVFTDATAGDHRLVGKVLDAVQRKQSQVVFVLTGHCNDLHKPSYKVYQQIAAASSGQVFNLNKTSVHEVLDFVRNAIKGRTVNLGSIIKPAGYNFTQGIPVDSTVGEVTVSVSGAKPHITVVDPSGQELTGPPKLVKTLDLSEIMVVKVLDPEPGNWSITVGSEKDYSVKVVGLSNLTFDHGFSVEPPSSMAETSYRPLQGTYNHMMLSLSGTDRPLHMKYVEVLNLGGKTLFEVPLREVNRDKHLYLTNAFVPPDDFFYIAINGRDEFNHEVRRVGTTAVQAKSPDVPYLMTTKKIEAHSHTHVSLKCYVESLVPVTAKWTKDMIAVQPEISSLQTTTIEHVIEDITEEDVGTYTCVAKNVAGISKAVTEVVLLVEPPQVAVEPANVTIELGEDVVITCTVLSEALLLKHQLVFNGNEKKYAINIDFEPNMEGYYKFVKTIYNATEKDAGMYTCIAVNRGGEVKQSTNITVNVQLISQILGSHPLFVAYNTDAQLVCHVENAELLQWIAPNGSVVERHVNGSVTESLDINNVIEDGSWQCIALRGSLNASDSVELMVLIEPNVSILGSDNITVLNGTTYEIVCEVKAKPKPKIVWFKGRDKLSRKAYRTVSSEPNVYRSVLTLDSSREDIQGNYVCSGENSAGTHKDKVTVNVRRKMTLVQGFSDSSVELHSNVELQCKVDGHPPAKVRWFHNTTQVSTTDKVHLSDDATTVYLEMVDVDDIGLYTCEADNGFETLRVNGTLNITGLDIPHLKTTPKVEAYSHTRVLLKCYVESIVPVTATWMKDVSVLQPEISSMKTNIIEYVIEDMSEEDVGNYTCNANNVIGITKATTEVVLLVNPPQVTVEPHNSSIDEGEDIIISCTVLSEVSLLKYQLVFNGTERNYTINITLEQNRKGNYKFDKTIHNASEKDAGMYTCIATNREGEARQSTNITVKASPISQILGYHSLPVAYNTDIQITCNVENAELVQWIASNGSVVELPVNGSSNESLNINNVIEDASWQCIAVRGTLKASDSVELKVFIVPHVSILGSHNITLLNGTTHEIVCEVRAKPTPKIVWFRGDKLLPEASRTISSESNVYRNVLTLNSSREDVQGNYVCSGENSAGTHKDNVTVNVIRKMILLQGFNDSSVELHSRVELQCKLDGHPPAKVRWFHNTKQLSRTDKVHLSNDTTTVYLEKVDVDDIGLYSCEADNGFEILRVNGTLNITGLDVPHLITTPKIEAYSHNRVLLTCYVDSIIPVTAEWTKDNSVLQPEASSLKSNTFEYVIEDMSKEDVGTYKCNARNVVGINKAITEVVLLVKPPEVTVKPRNSSIDEGEDVFISCIVISEVPLLKYQLMLNGTEIDYSINTTLEQNMKGYYKFDKIVHNVTEKDAGMYTCIAANREGETRQSTNIIVKARPISQILGSHSLSVAYNTDIQVTCNVGNAELVQWIHPNGSIVERHVNGSSNETLDINNVIEDGNWQCIAVRGALKAVDSAELKVFMKPIASILGSDNITMLNGTIHEIVCEVRAKPIPKIVWFRGDKLLPEASRTVSSESNVYRSVLTLDSSREDVHGDYVCCGENSAGTYKDNVTVNVIRKMTLLHGFNDTSVELYSQVELHCQIDSHPPAKIRWFHNTTQLSTTEKLHLSNDTTTVYIEMVNFNNLGLYTCEADNGFETLRVNGKLSVSGLEIPVISKTIQKQTVTRGDTTVIACRVIQGNPEPTIAWQYKSNSSGDFTSLPQDIAISESDEVVVLNATLEHSGIYRCLADNILGSDKHDVQLIVQYPPELSLPVEANNIEKKAHEVKAGEKVEFSCNAIGSPRPIVIWTKDGQPLAYSKNVHLSDENHLVIEKVSRHDSGLFTCNATSSLGSVHRNFTLYVYVPPKITKSLNETLQEMLEGQLVELPCVADGEPTPQVQWTHNGNIVDHDKKYVDDFGLRFVANLTDFGNYTCNVWSPYGNTSVSYSLYIWVAPYIEPPLEVLQDILVGSNVTLQCDVVGFPIPEVVWEFQEDLLSNNTKNLSFDDNGNLYLTHASSRHEGVYDCVAENLAGIARKSIYVKINEPPKIIDDNYTGPYIATHKDTALMLTCKGVGKPRPYVLWSKDEIYLDKDNRYEVAADGTLTIKSPTEEESGNYTCNVKNPYGSVNKTFEVHIYSLPTNTQADGSQSKITLLEGTNATIDCPIQASATDTVKWYKEAMLIATGSLQISNVSRSNSSTFACVVSNIAGSGYASMSVIVEWKPNFIHDAERMVEVVEGEDVYFDCQVDAKPAAKIQWLYNSKRLVFQDQDRLKLMSVKQREAGTYKCIVSNIHGTIVREFKLITLVPPFISEFDVLDVFLKEGVNATLECNAKGFPRPNLDWTYNNTNWHLENSSLTSANITSLSEGLYRCDARNKAGAAHLVYRVEVVTSARIKEIVSFTSGEGVSVEHTVEVVLNTRARISCHGTGKPTPIIQWLRNGRMVASNPPDIEYADLVLENTQTTQAGVYTCVSSNEAGSDEKKIKVDVLEPPQIFQELFQNANASQNNINMEVISGQAFYLHCHPYGNPLPEVYWYKDDLPLRFFDDTAVSTEFGEVIVVRKATEEQTGNYTCVAKNKVANTSISYLVDILVPPPKPKESTKQVAIIFGKDLTLSCPVEGSPLPNVMWIKHPYTEINEESPRMMLLEDNFQLVINKTEVSDSGNYSCIMTNKVGTTEVIFQVTVQKPPRIVANKDISMVESHVIPLMRSLVLKCEVEGNPKPKITWLKDTQQLSDSLSNIHRVLGNSLLAIWNANVRDAGQYICVAENEVGAQHRRFNVAIKVPGKWSSWNQWTICNVTCGLGYQSRMRLCQYIDESNNTIDNTTHSDKIVLDETACKGSVTERRKCHMPPCDNEVNSPKWSVWSKWSTCSSTCGVGTQTRTRRCKSKVKCIGDNVQIRKCPNLPQCEPRQGQHETSNDVYNSNEDSNNTNLYIPEAVYEMDPEVIDNSLRSTGNEEFYLTAVPKKSTVYDVNVTENLDQSARGPCEAGYTHNLTNNSCDDIDECVVESNHCHSTQVCVNTRGGYQCTCPTGYVSLGLGQRCMDVNECEQEIHGCEFACVNVAGGYVCACPRHLRLHIDKHHCVLPSLYQRPYEELENGEYISTSVEAPVKYTKNLDY